MDYNESYLAANSQGSLLNDSVNSNDRDISTNVTSRRRVTSRPITNSSPSSSAKTLSSATSIQTSSRPVNPFYLHKMEQSHSHGNDTINHIGVSKEHRRSENTAPQIPLSTSEKPEKPPKPYLSDYLNKKYNIDSTNRPSSMRVASSVPASVDPRSIHHDKDISASSAAEEKMSRRPVSMAVHRSSVSTAVSASNSVTASSLSRQTITQSTVDPSAHSKVTSPSHIEVPDNSKTSSSSRRPLSMAISSGMSKVLRGAGSSTSSSSTSHSQNLVGSAEKASATRRPASVAITGSHTASSDGTLHHSNASVSAKEISSSSAAFAAPSSMDDPVAAALASSITLRSRSKALISKMFPSSKSPTSESSVTGTIKAAVSSSVSTVSVESSATESHLVVMESSSSVVVSSRNDLVTPVKTSSFFTINDVSDSDNDDLQNETLLKHVDSDDIWDNTKYAVATVLTPEHPSTSGSVNQNIATPAVAEIRSRSSLPTPSTNVRLFSRRSSTPRIETPTAEELDESKMPHDQQHHVANNLIAKYIQLIADYSPSPLCEILLNSEPIITYFVVIFEIFFMLLWMFLQFLFGILKHVYVALKPYKIHYLLPSLVGLVMCFFGAHFMTLIATIEAYRSIRYESTLESINALITDFNLVWEANKQDDAIVTISTPVEETETVGVDSHAHIGHHHPPRSARKKLSRTSSKFHMERKSMGAAPVPDVLQITSRELVARKTMLFLRTVEPHRFLDAVIGINTGFVAVIATLKVQFAKTITLGNAVSKPIEQVANVYALPILESFVPVEYRKWTKPLLGYSIKSTCISIAWMLRRMMSSYHSAIRGGLLFSKNLFNYLYSMKYISVSIEDTPLDKLVGYSLAALGIYFQVYFRFSLPFPLNILLFPFTVLEYFLVWCVNNSSYIVQSM